MKLYFYSLPKIVHNAPPPFLSNRKIPPTPLNSEIKFFSLKPGPSDPHISPLTSWRYTQYLYQLNHSITHCSREKVITDLIALVLLPVFYILGSRKLALDLDYRLDNELKSIMTYSHFSRSLRSICIEFMVVFNDVVCSDELWWSLSLWFYDTKWKSVLSANSLLVSDAVFQNPLDIHIYFVGTNDKHDNSTEKIQSKTLLEVENNNSWATK